MSHKVELAVEIDNYAVIGKYPNDTKNSVTLVLKDQNQDVLLMHYNVYRRHMLTKNGYTINSECGTHFGILRNTPSCSYEQLKKLTQKLDQTKLRTFLNNIEKDKSFFYTF